MRRYKLIIVAIALTAFLVGGQLYCLKVLNYGAGRRSSKDGLTVETYEMHMSEKGHMTLTLAINECRENEEYRLMLVSEGKTRTYTVNVNSEGLISQNIPLQDGTYSAVVQCKRIDGEIQNARIFTGVHIAGGNLVLN
ncbi:MAG: hypothetical protein E7277_06000 [Lachnospiraceae bacterium]|nr:hypothetical protein [Lachnospiraceae bacterium]